jgi:uncharacterized protein YciI
MHYLLYYEKAADYQKTQKVHQEKHVDHVIRAMQRGDVLMAGSLDDPTDGSALLVFKTKENAAQFAKDDPYVEHGIVSKWFIRGWQTL